MLFPIGPHRHKQEKACSVAPFTWSSNEHCEYLGIKVPITPQLSQHSTLIQPQFNFHDYVSSALIGRDNFTDSFIGRKHNVQAFIASKMTYYFALAPTPPFKYLYRVQTQINNYIWSGGRRYVQANLFYHPYDTGGLNLYSMMRQNTTLKLKALNK